MSGILSNDSVNWHEVKGLLIGLLNYIAICTKHPWCLIWSIKRVSFLLTNATMRQKRLSSYPSKLPGCHCFSCWYNLICCCDGAPRGWGLYTGHIGPSCWALRVTALHFKVTYTVSIPEDLQNARTSVKFQNPGVNQIVGKFLLSCKSLEHLETFSFFFFFFPFYHCASVMST